ncbi:phenoloxidase-activating factor 3-like [Macrobrachium nipponense]|uniref:phenoloxidase-activating factor 3-like n=1 Tax=Macrobrachium nipponense TaxID=159736 RepID=UPI0030C87FED
MVSSKSICAVILMLMATTLCFCEFRVARQAASSCGAGAQCIPLRSCPSIVNLLQVPTTSNLLRVREALCENRRGNLRVCCNSPLTAAPTPTTVAEGALPARCGISLSSNRVFFGEFPPIGAYPWMAVLGYRSGANGGVEWKCGGALVNERYVLTAAHCVLPDLPLEEIRLGEHNLETVPDCTDSISGNRNCALRHQSFKVTSRSQIISHPNFDTRTPVSDDIALIRLDRKATLNNFVQPICLPDAQFTPKSFLGNQEAIVAGWGRTEQGFDSNILKRTNIPLVEIERCQPLYNVRLNADQLCFGGVGRRDSCNGDSGGPVFQADPRGISYLIGIVSFGNRCGEDPAIYTNVVPYRSWIIQNMRP